MNEQLRRRGNPTSAGPAPLTNQMMDSLEGCLENISADATQTAAKGGPLVELAASLALYYIILYYIILYNCRATAARNQAVVRADKRFEKERDSGCRRRDISRRRTGGDECMHTF